MLRVLRAMQRMAGALAPVTPTALALKIGDARWSLGDSSWCALVDSGALDGELDAIRHTGRPQRLSAQTWGAFGGATASLGVVELALLPLHGDGSEDASSAHGILAVGLHRAPTDAEQQHLEALADLCGASHVEHTQLAVLIEDLPIGIVVMTRAGAITNINRRGRALGDSLGVINDNWRDSLGQMRVEDLAGRPLPFDELPVVRTFAGLPTPPRELVLVGPDGKRRALVTSTEPIYDSAGEIDRVAFTFQDVSGLYELADARDRFLRIASHELRSPLTALGATTGLLRLDPTVLVDEQRRSTLIARIDRQVARLHLLVEQLLDSARIRSGATMLQRSDCELTTLVDEAIELSAIAQTHTVALHKPATLPFVADGPRLQQVLGNLLSNAARYSPPGSTVTVTLATTESGVFLEVSDEGIGIAPADLTQVFSPFFRGANATCAHRGGLGLGLHISFDIVKQHGGTLTARSELGHGATFTVSLPRS